MIKVYCDNGAFKRELKTLEKQGLMQMVMFPYENRNRKISTVGLPSEATFNDLDNFTWETLPGTFGDYAGSDKSAFQNLDAVQKVLAESSHYSASIARLGV